MDLNLIREFPYNRHLPNQTKLKLPVGFDFYIIEDSTAGQGKTYRLERTPRGGIQLTGYKGIENYQKN